MKQIIPYLCTDGFPAYIAGTVIHPAVNGVRQVRKNGIKPGGIMGWTLLVPAWKIRSLFVDTGIPHTDIQNTKEEAPNSDRMQISARIMLRES